jgi:DHA3 family macrolide efflux protein-like MFS transporter
VSGLIARPGENRRPEGMTAFAIISIGQLISMTGSGMVRFAITIFAWQETGEVTALAMVGFFAFAPAVLLSPLAGAIVDRANRKLVMMVSDLAAGLMTIVILILFTTDQLQIWHLFVTAAFAASFEAFQFPAYSAAITLMLPKDQYTRASGIHSLVHSGSMIASPILAGLLIGVIGIGGILVIDIVTFAVAILALFVVFIPQPKESAAGKEGQGSIWKESAYGFRYILDRPSLTGLLTIFFGINFIASFSMVLLSPMILARTGDDQVALGTVMSVFGLGGLVGGLFLSVWGGPKRRIHGILIGLALSSLLGITVLGFGQTTVVWAVGAFLMMFFIPVINGSSQAIWQSKVAPDVQGRVFSVRRLMAQITAPVAFLMAGPLADNIFEPAMMPGGSLEPSFSNLIGSGAGAGMSLIFIITALLGTVVSLAGYLVPAIRNIEDILPDYDEEPELIHVGTEHATTEQVATA